MVDKLLKALSHIGQSQAKYTSPSDVTKSKPFKTRDGHADTGNANISAYIR